MLKGEHVKIVEEAFVAMMIIIIITIIIAVVRPTKRNFSWIMPDFKVTDRIYWINLQKNRRVIFAPQIKVYIHSSAGKCDYPIGHTSP